jgi:hypothetical protein
MKAVAILVLLTVMLSGCGSNTAAVQQTSGAIWQAQLSGGEGSDSGLSFNTQFVINTDGSLGDTYVQFLNEGSCFPVTGEAPTGSISGINIDYSNGTVTGTLTNFTIQGNGNTLTLNGPLTGTETGAVSGTDNIPTFTSATIIGTWTLTGSSCSLTGGETSFTMTLCTSASSCPTT